MRIQNARAAVRRLACVMLVMLLGLARAAHAQSITEVYLPQYMQGLSGTNNDRVPFVYRATITGLTANATYSYLNTIVNSTTAGTANGPGNIIFPSTSAAFTRTSGPAFTAGNFGTFTADASGNYTGWFISEPSGNAVFVSGGTVNARINLNDGAGGTVVVTRPTTTSGITVLGFGATATDGTGLIGTSSFAGKNIALLYDNVAGTGRPIASALVESDGLDLPDANYVDFHDTSVDGIAGAFGTIIPNTFAAGIRRVEQRSLATGALVSVATSVNGVWGAVNTTNPTGGKTTPLTVAVTAGPLPDNPNIAAAPATIYISATNPTTTATAQLIITNTGSSAALNLTSSTLTGPGAARFKLPTSLPSAIAAGTSTTLAIRFNAAGSTALTTATLKLGSNDQSGDVPSIDLIAAAAPANMPTYKGLVISEISTQPTVDEFIEFKNTTSSTLSLAGLIVSDEDNNNTEGAVSFPAGTTMTPGQIVVLAVNNSTSEPTWLDTLPTGVKVFYEPARNVSTWTAAHGNTLTKMNDDTTTMGGTSSTIALSGGDGVALYAANVRFIVGIGPFPVTGTIDGMNYPLNDSGPPNPINPSGQFDTPATKVGAAEPIAGHGFTRTTNQPNTGSVFAFSDQAITPGTSTLPQQSAPPNAARNWARYE